MDLNSGRGRRPNGSRFAPGRALQAYLTDKQVRWVVGTGGEVPEDSQDSAEAEVVAAYRLLQSAADYRQTLQGWFEQVRVGGHLVVVVPHAFLYERQYSMPSRWDAGQKRLYTPASLMMEVEEALAPNSYRLRWLGDLDEDYDYRQLPECEPRGDSDIGLVIERLALPAWSLDEALLPAMVGSREKPDYLFEPVRTRVETERKVDARRILILKLDHLGDLVMSITALQRARSYFPDAMIDLMVGSWNVDLARDLAVADRVIGFDAFPRNSSEQEVDVHATIGLFKSLVADDYDLAIDLRTDVDTRALLRTVRAPMKAGIGTRARFPFLDIALPLDTTRNEAERVSDEHIIPARFIMQGSGTRRTFGLHSDRNRVEREHAIIWGPYLELDPGDYLFDFYLDLDMEQGSGLLKLDIALDHGRTVAEMVISGPDRYQLHFRVDKPRTSFEGRIRVVEGFPSISFGFYGGRLVKKGPGNVLHQAEYAALLIEQVKLRMLDFGMLDDVVPR